MLDMGFQGIAHHRLPQIDQSESYYTGAERASELQDLLNCQHRADGKSVHMPVGDILKVDG